MSSSCEGASWGCLFFSSNSKPEGIHEDLGPLTTASIWTVRPSRAIIISAPLPQSFHCHFLRRGNEHFSQRAEFPGVVSLRILRNPALDLCFIWSLICRARRRWRLCVQFHIQALQGPRRRAKDQRHADCPA